MFIADENDRSDIIHDVFVMKYLCSIILALLCFTSVVAAEVPAPIILPTPQKCELLEGTCLLSESENVKRIDQDDIPAEGYRLKIDNKGATIWCSDQSGYVYAQQTLKLLRLQYAKIGRIPNLLVSDAPRMQWRSFMLDSGRQYQRVSTIKKYIDMMSMLKFNRFHWHLTEGLGWRLEIQKYPKLAAIGAFVGQGPEQQGYYSHADIQEVIAYARERAITVVPEIDMPGHAEAALNAYPHLGCFGEAPTVPKEGFTQHIFCAGKPATIAFLKEVIDEVCELFPSEYIHLGGDEAPKGNWNTCPDCQRRIKDMGLKDTHDLQLWFAAEMATHLKTKGRKAIFWGDVVYTEGYPLPDNVAIHWWNWRGHQDLAYRNAIKGGHSIIAGTNNYSYLNFPVSPWSGYKADRTFDIEDIYTANPSNVKGANPLLMGMSASLWTDYNVTESMLDRRVFPRIFALAEQMWSQADNRGFALFYSDVKQLKPIFEGLHYAFGPGLRSEVSDTYSWEK
jgi:N-acetyl-beta-hexosaminidase